LIKTCWEGFPFEFKKLEMLQCKINSEGLENCLRIAIGSLVASKDVFPS
jgi:hypothetical protein